MKLIFALLALTISTNTYAALCKTTTDTGLTAFMFKPDTKGKVTPTATLSGTVASLPACAVTEIKVRKEVVETYVIPNPQNACERSAVAVCEPSFGGLPIGNVSGLKGYCGFVLLTTTSANEQDTTVRYLNGKVYDGTKSVDGAQETVCENGALK